MAMEEMATSAAATTGEARVGTGWTIMSWSDPKLYRFERAFHAVVGCDHVLYLQRVSCEPRQRIAECETTV